MALLIILQMETPLCVIKVRCRNIGESQLDPAKSASAEIGHQNIWSCIYVVWNWPVNSPARLRTPQPCVTWETFWLDPKRHHCSLRMTRQNPWLDSMYGKQAEAGVVELASTSFRHSRIAAFVKTELDIEILAW